MALVEINVSASRFASSECLNLLAPAENYEASAKTVATGVTNQQPTVANGWTTDLFDDVERIVVAKYVEIYSDKQITVRFNAVGNDPITCRAGEVRSIDYLLVKDIFITNASGENAAIEIVISGGK